MRWSIREPIRARKSFTKRREASGMRRELGTQVCHCAERSDEEYHPFETKTDPSVDVRMMEVEYRAMGTI